MVIALSHSPEITEATMGRLREDVLKMQSSPYAKVISRLKQSSSSTAQASLSSAVPFADAGLTGRKIIVDTYGGIGRHGGGAFSGKDPSKVDRSGAYMARYVAKNIVAAGITDECEVQLGYCIGIAEPTSVLVRAKGLTEKQEARLAKAVSEVFPLKPADIISHFGLRNPECWCYTNTAAFGHFGRRQFPWELTYMAKELLKAY